MDYKGFVGSNGPNPQLLVLSGPSAVGKGALKNRLVEKYKFRFVVSCTTRALRTGVVCKKTGKVYDEIDGVHYTHTDKKTFLRLKDEGFFLETNQVHEGVWYGTPKDKVMQLVNHGRHLLLDVEPVGATNIKNELGPLVLTVLIKPPSMRELERRMRESGGRDNIEERLELAKKELAFEPLFDCSLVNDNFEKACAELEHIIHQRMQRLQRL